MDKLDKLRSDIIESKTFCFYPFLEISTRPNGVVFPCCYWTEKDHLTKVDKISKNMPVEDFWNSKKFIHIRNELANNTELKGCEVCARDGNASMRARGIRENINNREYLKLVQTTIENSGKADHLPKRLELKPSNLCNLKCFMCNAFDSSQIEKELRELDQLHNGVKSHGGRLRHLAPGNPGVWEGFLNEYQLPDMRNLDWAETEEFWNDLTRLLPTLDVLSFAGGEPTVNPIVHKILQYCVDNDYAKNITVFISSNFTNLNKQFFELMPHYKKFELIASIDGIEEVQEYIRFPSKWRVINKNVEIARQYMKYSNIKILVNITVNILNIYYLDKLLMFIDEKFLEYPYYQEWPYNINLINYPEETRIDWIPLELRSEIIDKLKIYQDNSTTLKFFPELKIKTDLLINELLKGYDKQVSNYHLKILKETVNTLDNHRKIDYSKSVPFLDKIFKKGISDVR